MTLFRPLLPIIFIFIITSENLYGDEIDADGDNFAAAVWRTIKDDYSSFYSRKRLLRMGIVTSVGATLANTSADRSFQHWFQNDLRSQGTDDVSGISKNFGNYKYVLPAILVTSIADSVIENHFNNSMAGDWGKRSIRAYMLGLPLLWSSQVAIGASRPSEGEGSGWRPLADNNGVSGHAFTGAVPFLTLARLNEDNRYLQYLFYAASTLTAFSRINDDAHYLSQAALGWYIAWEATDTIADNEYAKEKLSISALPVPDGYGLQLGMRW